MRSAPSRRLLRRLAQHEGQYGISAVTWQELAYGVRRLPEGRRKRALQVRLLDIREVLPPILPFTADTADWLACELARLEKKCIPVACEDGQIAATASLSNLTLVTANVKDFASFHELTVVSWLT